MFKINDYVVYNSMGVYKICDITKDVYGNDKDILYYVLKSAFGDNLTIITPVNNPKVKMREVISKDDAYSLIDSMPEKKTNWISDVRQRNEEFKTALRKGDCESWIELIKTIYLEKQEKLDKGQKLARTDEEILKAAEKNLYEEFAVALEILPEDVPSYINHHLY